MTDPGAWVRRLREDNARRTVEAESYYEALRARGVLKSHRVITYRCPRHCMLAELLTSPAGLIVHQPGYKLSPRLNAETSNEAGRRRNTEDGNRRWRARTFALDDAGNVLLVCDHVAHHVLARAQLDADLLGHQPEVIIGTP